MQAGAPNFFALFFREGEEGGEINMDICMPSALTGFCFLMLERRIVRCAGEQDRMYIGTLWKTKISKNKKKQLKGFNMQFSPKIHDKKLILLILIRY